MGLDLDLDLKEILKKRIDLRGLLVEDLLINLVEKALDEVVADSSNPYDDMLAAALKPVLKKAAIEQIDKMLAKLEPEAPAPAPEA